MDIGKRCLFAHKGTQDNNAKNILSLCAESATLLLHDPHAFNVKIMSCQPQFSSASIPLASLVAFVIPPALLIRDIVVEKCMKTASVQ